MNIKSFKQFNEDTNKSAVFTFGRFQPPTIGHGKLFDKVASIAKANKATPKIFASQTLNKKKNPLDFNTKVKTIRKMFPKHARSVVADKSIKTALQAVAKLYKEGYSSVTMAAAGDRIKEFEILLNKYNGVDGAHGYYNFKDGVKVVSAGVRDPDAEGVEGMSGSKMRKAAAEDNFEEFKTGMPSSFKGAQQLFNDLRKAMGLKESVNFMQHVQLETVSAEREEFVKGELFTEGQDVIVKETDEAGIVESLGPNFVSVTLKNGISRFWLDQLKAA